MKFNRFVCTYKVQCWMKRCKLLWCCCSLMLNKKNILNLLYFEHPHCCPWHWASEANVKFTIESIAGLIGNLTYLRLVWDVAAGCIESYHQRVGGSHLSLERKRKKSISKSVRLIWSCQISPSRHQYIYSFSLHISDFTALCHSLIKAKRIFANVASG